MAETRVIAAPLGGFALLPKFNVATVRTVTVIACLAVWELAAVSGLFYRDVVPSVHKVVIAVAREIVDPAFYWHLWITFAEVAVGFVGGALIGIAGGIVLGTNKFLRAAIDPYLNAIGSTPKIIFLPIIFLICGVGIESKMVKGAFSGFFPTIFATTLGMILINPVLIKVGKTFNLTRAQMVSKVYIPAMVNPIVVGLRLGMAVTVIGILVAEIKFSDGGLGFRLIQYYDQFKIAPMYATLLLIFALAAFANFGMTRLQDRFNWNRDRSGKKRSSAGNLG